MNGLPRVNLDGADMVKEELMQVILQCEELIIRKYVRKQEDKRKQMMLKQSQQEAAARALDAEGNSPMANEDEEAAEQQALTSLP